MGQLDASVVALTYDSIGRSFHSTLAAVQWVSLTYLITLGAVLVPLGRLSDRIGRKRVYLWGFGLFTVSSAACALAPGLAALSALRAVQGLGAAMLQANSVAIVATAAPRARLRTALGMQASAQAVGLALGPTVGGLIVQTIGWRWVFAVNVPVGVVAMLAGRFLIPRTRVDAVSRGSLRDVLGVRTVRWGLLGALLAYLLLFGPIVLVPTVLQARGHSPFLVGLVVAALPAGFALGALAGERVVPGHWTSPRRCRLGAAILGAGIAGLLGTATAGGLPCAATLLVAGIGVGIFTPTNNAMIMSSVPDRSAAVAGGLVSACRAAGTAGGTLLVASTLGAGSSGAIAIWTMLALTALAAGSVSKATAGRSPSTATAHRRSSGEAGRRR
jgi:MFS family permease